MAGLSFRAEFACRLTTTLPATLTNPTSLSGPMLGDGGLLKHTDNLCPQLPEALQSPVTLLASARLSCHPCLITTIPRRPLVISRALLKSAAGTA